MAIRFEQLTPDDFIPAVETALETRLTGLATALPSYINRVYELEARSGDRLIVKFYRPGRWTAEAILDEHDFLWDCDEDEIPVVPPFELASGSTLEMLDNIPFAVFPRRRGREVELEQPGSYARVGALLGRIHACGKRNSASNRLVMTPESYSCRAMQTIFSAGIVPSSVETPLMQVCDDILDVAEDWFPAENTFFRIHGDFHRGNLLDRPGDGLTAIDFDDMAVGPAVQDLWLLLPGQLSESRAELDELLNAYTVFCEFDYHSLRIIEVLRAMRMMYFLSWCAMQRGDLRFQELYPDWGSLNFWRGELADFQRQLNVIEQTPAFL